MKLTHVQNNSLVRQQFGLLANSRQKQRKTKQVLKQQLTKEEGHN
jgi:hypothetical protein